MEKEQVALEALDFYSEKVRLIYHPYPGSDRAYLLAESLEYAADEGRFWELHDRLLKHVPEDEADLKELLGYMDFDVEDFDEALADSRYRTVIDQGLEEARASGVSSFGHYINGNRYSGAPEDFLKAIGAEIESVEVGN